MDYEQQKAKELAELLNAFAEGKQLEWFNQSHWIEIPIACSLKNLLVDYNVGVPFRIKPETKHVPLTMQDLVDRVKEGKTMWIALTDGGICQQITSFSWVYFTTNVGTYNYDQLADKFTFLDGTPCYKEVEDE